LRIIQAKIKGNRNDWSALHSVRVGETVEVKAAVIQMTTSDHVEIDYIRSFCNRAFGSGNYSVSVYGEKIVLTRKK
jgi:hypothetical protein